MDIAHEVLEEARAALARQVEDVLRKTESLRQLARFGIAATAGMLVGIGLLDATPDFVGRFLFAAAFVAILTGVVVATAAASLTEASDVLAGPDPEALHEMAKQGIDRLGFDRSRTEGLIRMHAYNQPTQAYLARWARLALFSLVVGAITAVIGFAFVAGGGIGA